MGREFCKIAVYPCILRVMNRYGLDPEWVVLYLLLIVADMISWVTKSRVLYSDWNPNWFSRSKFNKGFVGKTVAFWMFCLSIIVLSYLSKVGASVREFAGMSFLLVGQLIGVLHNGQQIQSKKPLPERDFTAKIYDYLIGFFKAVFEKMTEKRPML